MSGSAPLAGIRVLELGEGWVGPWALTLLSDLGAEVIKVEAIQHMDMTRGPVAPPPGLPTYPGKEPGPRPWDSNLSFYVANRNKLSLTLDLARPRGRELFYGLVRISDVFATNLVTGVPQKLGVDYESLRAVRPDIIVLAASGFGARGPYATHVAMGGSMDAAAGHTWLRSYADLTPDTVSASTHLDTVASVSGALALLMALYYRNETGQGQFIDLSGCEAFMPHIGEAIMDYTMNGIVRGPSGNRHPTQAPCGVYPCHGEDRWVAISISSDTEWERFCKALGDPAWCRDERFADVVGRRRHQDELDRLIAGWTRQHDHYEVMRILQGHGVPAAAVLDNREVYEDPHFVSRGFFQPVVHPDLPPIPLPGVVWKMSETPGGIHRYPPRLGEHNALVLKEILGLTAAAYRELEAEQYIGDTPLPGLVV
ncbi:MAG: CoA transferase [Chloroflexi bacterium]|nr:CoA transferase [Chloroflexota bacterium]